MTMNGSTVQNHTITALVRDKPGVLNRVSSMFRRRGSTSSALPSATARSRTSRA